MATVNHTPRSTTIIPASASAGPFLVGFRLFDSDGLSVYVNGVQTTDFAVMASYSDGYDDNARILMVAPVPAGSKLRIDGDMEPSRSMDYIPTDPSILQKINVELGRAWAALMEAYRDNKRSLRVDRAIPPWTPTPGRIPVWDGEKIVDGPNGADISGAGAAATAAVAAAAQVEAAAATLGGAIGKLDRTDYMELAAPYTVKPLGWRWPLQAFQGALGEAGKSVSAQSWTHVLDRAIKSGERIDIGGGAWPMREKLNATTGITITDDTPVDVHMSAKGEIILGPEYPWHSGGFLDVRAAGSASIDRKIPFRWIGGKFNAEGLLTAGASGISIFDIFQRTGFRIQDVQFWAGYNKNGGLWGNVDTAITTHNCNGGIIENCDFTGMYDAGVYLSGDYSAPSWDMVGEGEIVRGCRFRRVNNMVTFKRDHMGAFLQDNVGFEVGNGYLASPASGGAGNQGESLQIRGGRIIKCRGRPVYLETGLGAHVSDMLIEDFGHEIANPSTMTNVATGNNIAGIDLRGVQSAIVHDNVVRQREWAGTTASAAGTAVIGIRLGVDETATSTKNSLIHHNRIERVQRPLYEDAACAANRFEDNVEIAPGAGTILASAALGTGSVLLKPVLDFRADIDAGMIAANSSVIVNVPAVGVAQGDWVESWSLGNRNSGTAGVSSMTVEVYCKADAVEFILRNVTGSNINIGNTNYRARVRKA